MSPLWENNRMRVWKVAGCFVNLKVGEYEPEGFNYSFYSAFRPRAKQRGVLCGAPAFGEYHKTFHGSIRYDTLTVSTDGGEQLVVEDVIAIKKFQPYIYPGNRCTLYLLSAKNPGEATLIIALDTNGDRLEDLSGIGSIGDIMMASIRRQLKFIVIPAALSFVLFCVMMLSIIASIFGGFAYVAFGIICAILVLLSILGISIFKKFIDIYPSRALLRNLLQQEGFTFDKDIHSLPLPGSGDSL
jgi:hypothetical protein